MNKPVDIDSALDRSGPAGGDGRLPEPCAATMQSVRSAEAQDNPAAAAAETRGDLAPEELERLTDDIVQALKTVYDPEIPVDIYELGLIYRVDIDEDRAVDIDMTLTAPACPVAGEMPMWVENAVSGVEGVSHVNVNMVFDPPWSMERMSEEARVALDLY